MHTKRLIFAAVAICAALGIGYFVGLRGQDEDLKSGVVRAYQVPAEQAESIRSSINNLLRLKDGEAYGKAQVFDNGLMLVLAPKGYHHGIDKLVQNLTEQKPAPRPLIRLDYWVVTGQEDSATNDKSFGELTETLNAITKLDGARKFRILEHVSNNTSANEEGHIEGAVVKVFSTPSIANGRISLKLDFNSKFGKLKTNSQLTPGEFLVLGQNALASAKPEDGATSTNVYYIVRAQLLK